MARKNPPPSLVKQWLMRISQSQYFIWVVMMAGVLSCSMVFWTKAHHEWGARMFPIRQVSVSGAYFLDRTRLQQMLGPLMKGSFFSIYPAEIRHSIRTIPWVSDAMVRRVWPDRVVISIQERKPVARWNKTSLLSLTGDVFAPDNHFASDALPDFTGPPGSQWRVLKCYRMMQKMIQPVGSDIASLELTPLSSWQITLKNGIRLSVGRQDILTHLRHFVKVYPDVIGNRTAHVEYVDLRYPDGFAVRWKKQTLSKSS